jgi:enoyl-CoA hydratase/carnithine racemase
MSSTPPPELVLKNDAGHNVRVITLNRPEKRNALSQDVITSFLDELSAASSDAHVHVIVITGSGSFFSGDMTFPHPMVTNSIGKAQDS